MNGAARLGRNNLEGVVSGFHHQFFVGYVWLDEEYLVARLSTRGVPFQ